MSVYQFSTYFHSCEFFHFSILVFPCYIVHCSLFTYALKSIGFSLRQVATPEVVLKALSLLEFLRNSGKEVFLSDTTLLTLGDQLDPVQKKRISKNITLDLFIFLGGDGTLLRSLHEYAPKIFETPIVGVHAGNIGFFSSVLPEEAPQALENIFAYQGVSEDKRMVLEGSVEDKNGEIKTFYALNECTIHHAGIARLRHLSTWVDNEFLTTYRADGIIIASPTGSTAYNLAAGGPIVAIDTQGLVMTPLAPAGFSQRSIVLSSEKTISVQSDAHMLISVDGQKYFPFPSGATLRIKKHASPLVFLRQKEESYFSTLREKLGWG